MADEKKHDHKHCENCEAHRQAEREDLRERLKKCCEAREAARSQRETQMAEELEAAQAEASSLKKKLAAFQLATVVGVTILGQETFDKIMGKVDEAKAVTEKITGGGVKAEDAKDTKPAAPAKPSKPLSWSGGSRDTIVLSSEPISNIWGVPSYRGSQPKAIDKPVVYTETPAPSLWEVASSMSSHQLPLPPKADQLVYATPPVSTWSQYIFTIPSPEITPVVVTMSTGVEADWGDGAGVFVQPTVSAVPTPNTFSVFALSLINNGRRRNA